ncbi:MAG: PspC domain-containing protein [Propionibacteriaceae bacterium]|nr:PspC domain-containing protein [Propionibacteriaceae bacterium]
MPELVHPSQLDPRLADLQRPQHTGFTGGLCRALAERWRVDPIIVRLVAVALTLAGGVGIALYAWGWLLTPRVGGEPPILRWLPAFARWTRTTQLVIVGLSSLVLVLSSSAQTGIAWGPVIVVAALAWAMARRRQTNVAVPPRDPDAPSTSDVPADSSPADGETVEQWRARVGTHTGSPLPVVDLYAPAPARPIAAERPAHRTSWLAAVVVLLLTSAAASVPFVLGMTPALLWASIAAGAMAGLSLLMWSLLARTRRMPAALLILALAGAVGSGMLAVSQSQASAVPVDVVSGEVARYSFVGEPDAQVDLTGLPADVATTITINATASVVLVRLDEAPNSIQVDSDTIHVEGPSSRGGITTGKLDLIIDGDLSYVELEVAP